MPDNLITICVNLLPGADEPAIRRVVLGIHGKLLHAPKPTRFFASTSLTLRQVGNLQGVKNCTLSPTM